MNILVLTPIYQTPDLEGIRFDTRAVHDLVAPIAERHDVRVAFLYQHPFHDARLFFSPPCNRRRRDGYRYQVDGVKVDLIEMLKQPKRYSVELTNRQAGVIRKKIAGVLLRDDFSPDVVVAHMSTLFAPLFEDRFLIEATKVGVVHAADRLYAESQGDNVRRFESFDCVYGRSAPLLDYFIEKGYFRMQRSCVFSGVEIAKSSKPLERLGVRKYAAMFAGKLIARKNVNLIIESFAVFHKEDDAKLLIVGDGAERERLEKLAYEKLGPQRCEFVGSVPHKTVYEYMSQADLS